MWAHCEGGDLTLASASEAGWREGEGVISGLGRSVKMRRKGNQGLCELCLPSSAARRGQHGINYGCLLSKACFTTSFLSQAVLQCAYPKKQQRKEESSALG